MMRRLRTALRAFPPTWNSGSGRHAPDALGEDGSPFTYLLTGGPCGGLGGEGRERCSFRLRASRGVVGGRWRRAAGLAMFWSGLGLVRSRSPKLALGLHVAANASGVLLGHLNRRDTF